MKAFIEEGCIACGLCVNTCEEVFDFGEDGLAYVKKSPEAGEEETLVIAAAESCPVSVISFEY